MVRRRAALGTVLGALVVTLAPVGPGGPARPAGAAGPPLVDLAANIPEDLGAPSFCATVPDDGPSCLAVELHDTNVARRALGLGPMVLPADFTELPGAEEELIVANWERQAYGLGLFPALDLRLSQGAATLDPGGPLTDPVLPAGYPAGTWQSILASGSPNVLGADYQWMYNDGPGGTNLDCTAAAPGGCWGHRQAILSDDQPQPAMGGAVLEVLHAPAYSEIFASDTESGGPGAPVLEFGCASPQAGDLFWCPAYVVPTQVPEVLSLSPSGGRTEAPPAPVRMAGNYFSYGDLGDSATGVLFGGVPGHDLVLEGDGWLTVTPPPDPLGRTYASVPITMTYRTPAGRVTGAPVCLRSGGAPCTYTYAGPPAVSRIRPATTSTAGGTRLEVWGRALDSPGTRICFASRCVRPTRASGGRAEVMAPPALHPGPVPVTARNAFGASRAGSLSLRYLSPFAWFR